MLKKALIIIPNISNETQLCDFLRQTQKKLQQHNEVFVVDYYQSFNLLPFRRFRLIDRLNKSLYFLFLQVYISIRYYEKGRSYYLWMFFPQLSPAVVFKLPWWKVIFDMVDYHDSPNFSEKKELQKQKKYLLKKADYVFSISNTLRNIYQNDVKRKIHVVPQGFDLDGFAINQKKTPLTFPGDKPVVGFIGQISQRLDFNLLFELIAQNHQWNFVFVGPPHYESSVSVNYSQGKFQKLLRYKNVYYFNARPRVEMLSIVRKFSVCIIPYDVTYDFNRYSYPMKVFEYFYAQKPVVSTPIRELYKFCDYVAIAKTSDTFAASIQSFLEKPLSPSMKKSQLTLAKDNSWEKKITTISRYLLQ